jgi:hypothetical protein
MVTSCAVHGAPKNRQGEEIKAFETWPDTATEVFIVPSHAKETSLVPPNVLLPGSTIEKLLFAITGQMLPLCTHALLAQVTGMQELVVGQAVSLMQQPGTGV